MNQKQWILGLAMGLVSSSAGAATTKYWITRASTCANYKNVANPPNGSLFQAKDLMRAYTDNFYYGYCDVKLPDNATIKYGRAYGADNSIQSMSFAIRYATYCSDDYNNIVQWSSADNGDDPVCGDADWTSGVVTHAVNNGVNTYYFYYQIPYALDPDDLRLWNVEIQYEVP